MLWLLALAQPGRPMGQARGRAGGCIRVLLFSNGCRSTSSTCRLHSGSSSRKRAPWWARDTSPGVGTWPPPISPTAEIV
jgi:hypothetical protein